MFEIFIRRPILSGVISVVIVFLGLLAITSLPITQFPDIVPPSVTVTARYTGANADVMAKTVATPLERGLTPAIFVSVLAYHRLWACPYLYSTLL